MAMRFHPDKNPSPSAKDQFIRITEAYEILLGKKKIPASSNTRVSKSKEQQSQEERIRMAKNRFHDQQQKEKRANELFYKSLFTGWKWRLVKLTSVIGCILALCIILDYVLPSHYEQDRITHYSMRAWRGFSESMPSAVRTAKENEYWISGMNYQLYGQFPDIFVERSWIFHNPINLVSFQKVGYEYYPVRYTYYTGGIYFTVIFLLPFIARVYKRRTPFYTMLYYLSVYITPLMILIFLFSGDKWAHLITLGFL